MIFFWNTNWEHFNICFLGNELLQWTPFRNWIFFGCDHLVFWLKRIFGFCCRVINMRTFWFIAHGKMSKRLLPYGGGLYECGYHQKHKNTRSVRVLKYGRRHDSWRPLASSIICGNKTTTQSIAISGCDPQQLGPEYCDKAKPKNSFN